MNVKQLVSKQDKFDKVIFLVICVASVVGAASVVIAMAFPGLGTS